MRWSNEQLRPLAERIGVDVAAFGAVVDVESAGFGVTEHGPVIRLEVHQFWRNASPAKRVEIDKRFRVEGPEPWEGHFWRDEGGHWLALHQPDGQQLEWAAYRCATAIDYTAATLATSFGLAQILGTHWHDCGFDRLPAFVVGQSTEIGQLDSFAKLVAAVPEYIGPLRKHDWPTFTAAYNGKGKIADYSAKLQKAFATRRSA